MPVLTHMFTGLGCIAVSNSQHGLPEVWLSSLSRNKKLWKPLRLSNILPGAGYANDSFFDIWATCLIQNSLLLPLHGTAYGLCISGGL